MAWKLTVAGTDRTTLIWRGEPVTFERLLNDRATAEFTCQPGLQPARLSEVVIYATDGTTPLFGGLVIPGGRSWEGVSHGSSDLRTGIECGDFFTYLDWTYLSLTYTTGPSLKTVLQAIVAALPASTGITLAAAQATGPTLEPFEWAYKKASDACRELSARAGYVVRVSPTKVLSAAVPGLTPAGASNPAPFSITDAAWHCDELTGKDNDRLPANKVILLCGPSGSAWHTYAWTANGSASSWVMDIPAAGPGVGRTLLLVIGGSNVYATVDEGTGGWFTWDWATATITVNNYPLTLPIPNGTAMSFEYLAQYPFPVVAEVVETPVVEYLASNPDVLTPAHGQEIADGLLAQLHQPTAREITFWSREHGWEPGQALTVALSARGVTGSFVITSVSVELTTDATWYYTVQAVESTVYQGNYLDEWRALTGGGGSSLVAIGGITGGTVGGASASAVSAHLGGSRSELLASSSWTPIVHYQTFRCLATGTYTFRTEAMTTAVGTSVSVRLYDVSAGAVVTGGTVAASTATVWAESMLTVALIEGHRYRAELMGGNTSAPVVVGQATIEPLAEEATTDYWAENRPEAGTARSLPTRLMPSDNWWNVSVASAPLDAKSADFIDFCSGGAPALGGTPGVLHVSTDWGNNYGMPYCTVSGNYPKIVFDHISYSGGASGDDARGFPIPIPALTEAGWTEDLAGTINTPVSTGDRHLLIFDVDNQYLYEIYQPFHNGTASPVSYREFTVQPGEYACASCSFWDTKTNNVRPDGVTSSDAAGLQVLPGLVNYDEIISGDPILHAHRLCLFSNSSDEPKYVWPATHEAGSWTADHPPLGTRFRLKASYDASSEYAVCQTFITSLKNYGLIFVDRGGHGQMTGTNDARWGDTDDYPRVQLIDTISRIGIADFEIVELGWGEP